MSTALFSRLRDRRVSSRRLAAIGVLLAVCAALGEGAIELWRFGSNQVAAAARVERQVRRNFDRMTDVLSRVTLGVAKDPDAARDLFDLVDRRLSDVGPVADAVALTIYDTDGVALAWAGRPSEMVSERLAGPSAFFVTPSPLGLRLVHILPIVAADQRRLGSVAAEYVLSPAPATIIASDFVLDTPLGPASLRMRWEIAGDEPRPNAFLLHAPSGEPLVEVSMSPADLDAARHAWRRSVSATVLTIAGLTILLLIGPILDRRAAAPGPAAFLRSTALALALLASGSLVFALALAMELGRRPPPSALLLLGGITTAAAGLLYIWDGVRQLGDSPSSTEWKD